VWIGRREPHEPNPAIHVVQSDRVIDVVGIERFSIAFGGFQVAEAARG